MNSNQQCDVWRYRCSEHECKCFDAISILHERIPGSEVLLYRIRREDGKPIYVRDDEQATSVWIHVNLMFEYNDCYWIYDYRWTRFSSIFGPFASKNELLNNWLKIMKGLIDHEFKSYFLIVILDYKEPRIGSTLKEIQELELDE